LRKVGIRKPLRIQMLLFDSPKKRVRVQEKVKNVSWH